MSDGITNHPDPPPTEWPSDVTGFAQVLKDVATKYSQLLRGQVCILISFASFILVFTWLDAAVTGLDEHANK
jgi:hypothetical protein